MNMKFYSEKDEIQKGENSVKARKLQHMKSKRQVELTSQDGKYLQFGGL